MHTVEREAKLFEAGSYPDRAVEISEEDLDIIAANTGEVPVRIEHIATPFDGALGVLKSVYRKGKELFGKLCFTQAAWELIKVAGAKRLSVAIRGDKSAIAEVSLVREPRVADAAVFGGAGVVSLGATEIPLSTDIEVASFGKSEADSEIARLRRELVERDAQATVDSLKRAGKLVPAAENFARAILTTGDTDVITFAGESLPIREVFLRFLEAQPKVIEFGELAPALPRDAAEPELFRKLGVTTRQVEKHRSR